MRDYGTHVIPNVSALPASGVAGQKVCLAGSHYYWNTGFAQWLQMDDWDESYLTAAYSNSTTTLSTVYSIAVSANAIYEIEWKFQWQTSTLIGMKVALTVPSGSFAASGTISGVTNGTTAPVFVELNVSGTAQAGPTAGAATSNALSYGKGIAIVGTTAGSIALQAAATGTGVLTIAKGGILKSRRIG